MRIAVYGGSFNPPHRMHAAMAERIALRDGIRVAFMISLDNVDPGKNKITNLFDRIRWVAATGYPVIICNNAYFNNNADDLRHRGTRGDITFITGADTATRWVEAGIDVDDKVKAIVYPREGYPNVEHDALRYENNAVDLVSSTEVRDLISKLKERVDSRVLKEVFNA